jgi:putative DNA primase/helicase
LLLLDNSETGKAVGGACLDAAITSRTICGRLLGASKFMSDLPFDVTIFITGNNLSVRADTLRRTIWTRLETTEEYPEERGGFAIPNLIEDVRTRRATLATSGLTILRGYHCAGRPTPTPKPVPMGGFEEWSRLIRFAVHWATDSDPLQTRAEARSVDQASRLLAGLIRGWARLCRVADATAGLTAQAALQALERDPQEHAGLRDLLAEQVRDGGLPSPQMLGNLLGRLRGRPYAGHTLERTEIRGLYRWFVRSTATGEPVAHEDAIPDTETQ